MPQTGSWSAIAARNSPTRRALQDCAAPRQRTVISGGRERPLSSIDFDLDNFDLDNFDLDNFDTDDLFGDDLYEAMSQLAMRRILPPTALRTKTHTANTAPRKTGVLTKEQNMHMFGYSASAAIRLGLLSPLRGDERWWI
jgi:hypothetical protein